MADRTATLTFKEYPGEEFTVRVQPVPLEAFYDVDTAIEALQEKATAENYVGLAEALGPYFEGGASGLRRLDPNLIFMIAILWRGEVRNVPLPLPQPPSRGGSSRSPRSSRRKSPEPSSPTAG
jgi:hypothetical protein